MVELICHIHQCKLDGSTLESKEHVNFNKFSHPLVFLALDQTTF